MLDSLYVSKLKPAMISAIFLQKKNIELSQEPLCKLARYCPQVEVIAQLTNLNEASTIIKTNKPQLVIFDLEESLNKGLAMLSGEPNFEYETIVLSNDPAHFSQSIKYCSIGFILKPIDETNLILTIRHVEKRFRAKEEFKTRTHISNLRLNNVIGVPTMEGYEFLVIRDIIRCEGLQKCTRVITKNRKEIVSSYNLGEFRKRLKLFGFYSPHKSHLINLSEVIRYFRDGRVQMSDLSNVPVSRRRKNDFLGFLLHL